MDDYTPLDPAYLTPGLEEDASDKETSRGANESLDEVDLIINSVLWDTFIK